MGSSEERCSVKRRFDFSETKTGKSGPLDFRGFHTFPLCFPNFQLNNEQEFMDLFRDRSQRKRNCMSFFRFENDCRVVLITGASTGIGLALAKLLAKYSFRLVLTARESSLVRFERAGVRESERLMLRPLDLAHPNEAERVVREVTARWGSVDVLVNNAGVCYRSVIEHFEKENEEHQFQTNYFGPLNLIRLVLPSMRAHYSGRIINISSVGGMMAMPTMGGYSASKFALEGASEALWYELKPWGIQVTLVEPGFVHSNSFQKALFTPKSKQAFEDTHDPYHAYYRHLIALITRMMKMSPTRPEHIAKKILKVMRQRHPPLRLPVTSDALFFSLLRRFLPARLYHWILFRNLPHLRTWVVNPKMIQTHKNGLDENKETNHVPTPKL